MPYDTPDMIGYRLLQRVMVACAALIVTVQILFLVVALDKSQARCQEVQNIRAYILSATERSLVTTPRLAYYKEHPDELADVMEALHQQRDTFRPPLRCSLI